MDLPEWLLLPCFVFCVWIHSVPPLLVSQFELLPLPPAIWCMNFLLHEYVHVSVFGLKQLLSSCVHKAYTQSVLCKSSKKGNVMTIIYSQRKLMTFLIPLQSFCIFMDAFRRIINSFLVRWVRICLWMRLTAWARTSALLASNSAICPALRNTLVFPIWGARKANNAIFLS